MKKIIKKITEKFKTKEVILYIVFGILTTILNVGISSILVKVFGIEGNLSSTIGIILAVLVAYLTNRKMVFDSQANGINETMMEFLKFILGRAFTMILEMVGVYLFYSIIGIEYVITKLGMTIIVVIVNYFLSKFVAFKN